MERKLAAILAADVVGYSRLMEIDEAGTLGALKAHREALIDPAIAERRGRIVKLMGDGSLVEFASVVDAVSCALAIQEGMAERNEGVPENRRMAFRIGVHLGDVIVEGDDLYGDGVNVAARLEGLAEPGGVCISQQAFDQVETKLDLAYEDLGEQQVKNIARPVRTYRVRPEGAAPPEPKTAKRRGLSATQIIGSAAVVVLVVAGLALGWWQPWKPDVEPASVERMAFPLPEKPSIAVLAFDNLSGDPKQEYFADGITDNVITELARFRNLFVVARNSSFTFKGKAVKVQQVAEDLGVQYVLEGSVQRSKERIRINVQLIDAITGRHLWAERYDKELNDLFAVQDEVTRQIVATLATESGRLAKAWQERTARKGTESLNAYELDLRGWKAYGPWTKEAFARAEKLFEEAIAADPGYARPYANLALILVWQVYAGLSESPDESITRARDLAKEAIARDDAESWGHWALGAVYLKQGLHDQAIAEYERALELNPNDADVLAESAWPLAWSGRPEEGIENARTAMRLNPRYGDWYLWALGVAYYEARRYEEAIATLESMNNRIYKSRLFLAAAYAQAGLETEARAEVEDILERDPDSSIARWGRVQPYKFTADLEHYIDGLRKARLPEEPPLPLPDKPSIAVLPFSNMSDDPSQEYFADGITEDLTTDLSKISGLFVIARNSAFAYKGKNVDVKRVARELGVKYVLEGSVRRAGDQVRINAQLIDATTGGHLWAERYDGTLDDVFALHDKVTQNIVTALAVNLTAVERDQQARKETDSPEAYDAFLRGWARYRLYTSEDLAKSVPYFEQAIQLDPNYGRAHAALATVYWESWINDWVKSLGMSFAEVGEKARRHLEEALKDPTPLAHRVAADMHSAAGRWDEAIADAERAIALDANDPDGYEAMGKVLVRVGRPAEGLESIETAMRLDPQSDYLYRLGGAQFHLERYDEAAVTLLRATKRNPGVARNFLLLAAAYGQLGREPKAESAIETFNKMRARAGQHLLSLAEIGGWWFKDSATRERLRGGLRKAGLPEG